MRAGAASARPNSRLEGRMTEAVVSRPLLRIFQDVVGLVDFLEPVLGGLVARLCIRMILLGELAEGALQLLLVSGPPHPKNFVIVAFGHGAVVISWLA
jgi:hypothetical protein